MESTGCKRPAAIFRVVRPESPQGPALRSGERRGRATGRTVPTTSGRPAVGERAAIPAIPAGQPGPARRGREPAPFHAV